MLVCNLGYVVWLAFHVEGALGDVFLLLELSVFGVGVLFAINHWTRKFVLLGGAYSLRSSLDVFVPTVDEPLDILEKTLVAAANIDYPELHLYLLDDGGREEVKQLALKHGFTYLQRPKTSNKRYKAGNLNYGLAHSTSPYVLTIDADNVVEPTIADDLLGHFADPKVAFVASRQEYIAEEDDFNHDHLFYNHMQTGKNANTAAISCGSGVIYRRSALEKVEGFSEWNLVEDLHTSYILQSKGYTSVYVSQPYVRGLAPKDISGVYKQRGTWAVDTLRILYWDSPLFKPGLSLRQRLHYFEMAYCYLVSGIFLPSIYLINFYTLYSDHLIQSGGLWYIVFRLPALLTTLWFFGYLSKGQLTSRVWTGLFPVYAKAAILALFFRKSKPRYKVTSKVDKGSREFILVTPQLLFITAGIVGVIFNFERYGPSLILGFSGFWTCVMIYWLTPITLKAMKLGKYKKEHFKYRTAAKTVS
jgi:cellulose synthase (UDP-forming)